MKKFLLLSVIGLMFTYKSYSQTIPYGVSIDSITVTLYEDLEDNIPDYSASSLYEVYYYKPLNYDTINSPILFGIHGQGGNGYSEIPDLKSIADRRGALIVAPTMHSNWAIAMEGIQSPDSCYHSYWLVNAITQIYRHILTKENKNSISVYLIGFSAGGQFVTRYVLLRQIIPDSIPIIMAISVSPYSYTFCTDTLNGILMTYPCGIGGYSIHNNIICSPQVPYDTIYYYNYFKCNEHIIQYYNENYTVMIGTDDTALSTFWCYTAQGSNHYERALNFYNFSDSDAVARGTTLQWQYGEVPGDSIPLAERLLFETPYHPVPQIAPLANFTTDDTIVSLPNATVQFDNWSINSMYYLWDFGDSTTSTGNYPVHTYLYADTFTVSLVAISGTGCENKMVKNNYIIANNGTGITNEKDNIGQLQINPNPSEGQITIKTGNVAIESIVIYNYFGNKADEIIVNGNSSSYIYNSKNMNGMYFIKVKTKKNVYTGKIIFR